MPLMIRRPRHSTGRGEPTFSETIFTTLTSVLQKPGGGKGNGKEEERGGLALPPSTQTQPPVGQAISERQYGQPVNARVSGSSQRGQLVNALVSGSEKPTPDTSPRSNCFRVSKLSLNFLLFFIVISFGGLALQDKMRETEAYDVMTELRPATAADLEPVLGLHRDFFREDGYPFHAEESRTNLARLLGDPNLGRLWVMDDGGTLVGYLVLAFGFSLEFRGRDAVIDELYVAPSHRARGLGRRALAVAEAACRELGVRAIHLVVERKKENARTLYRRAGFVAPDRELMTKRLEESANG
jgi:ribosomal protein S18 acetylase RimI-like enzyme